MTAAARYLVAGYYEVYAIFTHQSYFIIGVSTKTYLETSAFTLTRILKRISERNMKTQPTDLKILSEVSKYIIVYIIRQKVGKAP